MENTLINLWWNLGKVSLWEQESNFSCLDGAGGEKKKTIKKRVRKARTKVGVWGSGGHGGIIVGCPLYCVFRTLRGRGWMILNFKWFDCYRVNLSLIKEIIPNKYSLNPTTFVITLYDFVYYFALWKMKNSQNFVAYNKCTALAEQESRR